MPAIGWGSWQILKTGLPQVLAMHYHWQQSALVILHNFDEKPHEVLLTLPQNEERLEDLMVAKERSLADKKGRHHLTLEAYGYRWFRVGGPGERP